MIKRKRKRKPSKEYSVQYQKIRTNVKFTKEKKKKKDNRDFVDFLFFIFSLNGAVNNFGFVNLSNK